MKILLVEDDVALQDAYQFILTTEGYEVSTAYNGKEGLQLVEKDSYDLILLDINMPVMNGLEFLEHYKTDKPASTKIVVFSNMVEPEIETQAMELGADKSVLKSSMTPASILQLINELTSGAT